MNCKHCGQPLNMSDTICSHCGNLQTDPPTAPTQKPENVITGILGALVGALLGAVAIILFAQINVVSAISGFILAICTLKGYELLGHRLSVKGLIVCIVLILVTPYFSDRISWAIIVLRDLPGMFTFGEAYRVLPALIQEGMVERSAYLSSLGMLYLFTVLGSVGTVIGQFKKRK